MLLKSIRTQSSELGEGQPACCTVLKRAGDWASSFQHCLFMATAVPGHRAKHRSVTQLSPEPVDGGEPHACRGLLPSEARRPCGGGLLPELEKTEGIYCPTLSNMFHYSWMRNNPFKTIFTLAVIRVHGRSHKAIKVSLLQSLLESVVIQHIIKS